MGEHAYFSPSCPQPLMSDSAVLPLRPRIAPTSSGLSVRQLPDPTYIAVSASARAPLPAAAALGTLLPLSVLSAITQSPLSALSLSHSHAALPPCPQIIKACQHAEEKTAGLVDPKSLAAR